MRNKFYLINLMLAITVLAVAKTLPSSGFWALIVPVSLMSWLVSGLAWNSVARALDEISAWINQAWRGPAPDAGQPELEPIASALASAAQEINAELSQLAADKQTAELILSNMLDGVILTDTSTKVLLANPAAGKIFRLDSDQFIGRPLIHSIHSQELHRLINQVITLSEEAEAEIEIFMPVERRLRAVALPVLDEAALSAVLIVFQDVTRSYRVEAMRRDFVSNVSHELKTPVAGINLLADSLTGMVSGGDLKMAGRFAAKLSRESKRLAQLVSDLLDLSQLESPDTKPLFTPLSLTGIAKRVVADFTEAAAARGLSLRTELALDLPVINGSEDQLMLMLRNLIENSVRYTPTGGDILIRTFAADNRVVIEVEDTGFGIPAGDRRRIFERFYRVDKARSRETGGTGLGLSIVKHVVENHEGRIDVKSTVGLGSKFTISLPVSVQTAIPTV